MKNTIAKRRVRPRPSTAKKNIISHTKKPIELSVTEWQAVLRKQIATMQKFTITNTGDGEVFSDYRVFNPVSGNSYKVAIRSKDHSLNFCSCYDFKTNQLGTCKHIEAVLAGITKKRALRKIMNGKYEPAYSSIYLFYKEERKVKARIGTDDKVAFERLFTNYFDKELTLKEEAFTQMEELMQEASAINSSFRCYDDALDYIIKFREKQYRNAFLKKYSKEILPPIKDLNVNMFPYQKEGVRFCLEAGRAILADDMGLGKTIQAIAYSELMDQYFGIEKILIVCPTSLKYQWKSEIEKFTKSSVTVVEGNLLSRMRIYKEDKSTYKIVTYNVISNNWKYINEQHPDLIILDEAQRIKNWKTKISQNVKRLESNYALVLTGTPPCKYSNFTFLFSSSRETNRVIRSHWLKMTTFSPSIEKIPSRMFSSSSILVWKFVCWSMMYVESHTIRIMFRFIISDFLSCSVRKPLLRHLATSFATLSAYSLCNSVCSSVTATNRFLSVRSGNCCITCFFVLRSIVPTRTFEISCRSL